MSLPKAFFSEKEIDSIENCCADADEFTTLHCTITEQVVDVAGNTECAICFGTFDEDPQYPIFGDKHDLNTRLVQMNDKCTHAFHVGCMGETLLIRPTCPLCRCVWFVDTPAQRFNDWIRTFINQLSAGQHQDEADIADELITINAYELGYLVRILAYFLASRGPQAGSRFVNATIVANSSDGHALVTALLAHITTVAGKRRRKKAFLVTDLRSKTVAQLRQGGDDRIISPEMLALMDIMASLLFSTYDHYIADTKDF